MLYDIAKFLLGIVFKLLYKFEVNGIENVPKEGSLIICSNHSNNLDPIVLAVAFPRKINWMAKKELFKNKLIAYLLSEVGAFPVDRNNADLKAIKKALRLLKEDKVLGIFPEGTRVESLNYDNAKPGTAMLMVKSKATVLPIHIDSDYKLFKKIKFTIGSPIDFHDEKSKKYTSEEYLSISKNILKNIYDLK